VNPALQGKRRVSEPVSLIAGAAIVSEVDLLVPAAAASEASEVCRIVGGTDTRPGGTALPCFLLPLQNLFGELDRQVGSAP
jgi:hypothetical protein